MTEDELDAAVERVIDYLSQCGEGDIEAGIGTIEGLGSAPGPIEFRLKLREAIKGSA
jgi:hypothetical protein